ARHRVHRVLGRQVLRAQDLGPVAPRGARRVDGVTDGCHEVLPGSEHPSTSIIVLGSAVRCKLLTPTRAFSTSLACGSLRAPASSSPSLAGYSDRRSELQLGRPFPTPNPGVFDAWAVGEWGASLMGAARSPLARYGGNGACWL